MVSLSPSVCYEVAHHCDNAERLSLYRLSKRVRSVMRGLFYRNIQVKGNAATLVVRSLALNADLCKLVECLWFLDRYVLVEGKHWAAALPRMKNLWFLIIAGTIDIPRHIIPRIPFQLRFFGSVSNVSGNWPYFLVTQVALEEIAINGEFRGAYPGRGTLPSLRHVKLMALDLTHLVPRHPELTDIWFLTRNHLAERTLRFEDAQKFARTSYPQLTALRIGVPELLPLLRAAPRMLYGLRDLVLDEDLTWSGFTLEDEPQETDEVLYLWESPLRSLAECLNKRFRELETVFLVFHPGENSRINNNRRLLSCSDARCFATVFASYATAPLFQTLRIKAADGYAVCKDWDVYGMKYFPLEDKRRVQTPRYARIFNHEDDNF
ncbi:hypothetical protein R3P38DRAFT_2784973 [Favolaschia claudopus]|uniref:F-box domain-containing protein n=1 Tax=Favolaschia claudopus TaxID=2862362 RepID=A0AAW0AW57_9AGAR